MQTKLPLSFVLALPILAQAQNLLDERPLLPLPQSAALEQNHEIILLPQNTTPTSSELPENTNQQTELSPDDIQINRAIRQRNFDELAQLLAKEPQPDHNPLLRLDAKAALALSQQNYSQATDYYEQILQADPDSHGVRLDLAASLFANKRLRDAKREFQHVKNHTENAPAWHQKADYYIDSINKSEKWQPEISANYVQTDNVNNATENDTFIINGLTFHKHQNDKPQSARGFVYRVGANREHNIRGHHYVGAQLGMDGVHYFGKSKFNEQSADIESQYRHKTAKQNIGLSLSGTQRWVGGERYNRSFGVKTDYFRQLGQTWGSYLSLQHEQIRYQNQNTARYYDGFNNNVNVRVQKRIGKSTMIFAGLQTQKSHKKDRSESSFAKGANIGLNFKKNAWGTRVYVRYNHRLFDEAHYLFGLRRKDHEWRASASVHHDKLSWKGMTPELNYVFDKYESNVNLYNRKLGQFFISLAKNFG